ncbi:MAG: Fe-Mn family superoxide dismutase [Gammaproteobacteria bacterium]|nr:Fe-Mn family superoxide dismutase [Gammaproteobacteria bacterium]
MPYAVQPLPFKPSALHGLSERLLASHYVNNYGGAVRRLNAIEAELGAPEAAGQPGFRRNGLGREALIAANSVILHEAYFDVLGGSGEPTGDLADALARDFGSLERWRRDFVAAGKALAGGSGWILLSWSPRLGRLVNQWAADHGHCLADGHPVLALDMYEHAYHLDFGADAGAYVDAFMRDVAWDRVAARYRRAVAGVTAEAVTPVSARAEIAVAELQALMDGDAVLVLDVRKREDLARSGARLPGALVRPADELREWADGIPRDRPLVAYCVYGFQVCRGAAAELAAHGHDVRVLAGGFAAWQASGGSTEPLDESTKEIRQ